MPDGTWDEAIGADGHPRGRHAEVLAALAEADLPTLTAGIAATLAEQGVGFGDGEAASPFVVDPVPRIVEPQEWRLLERALAQRAEALAAFALDVHGRREIVAEGVVPARVLESADYVELDAGRLPQGNAAWVAGLDLVRGEDGRLRVLEDNLRTPSGIAYALAARCAVDARAPFTPPSGRLDPRAAIDLLGASLRASAPEGVEEPVVALLTDGPSNSAWYEHRVLADTLGIPIVLPDQLRLRGERLLADMGDSRPLAVDVVYRRTDEDRLRKADGSPTWLAEKLLPPLEAGNLAVANPFGFGVADDKLVHAYVEEMIRFYKREEPLIESVRTYDLGREDVLAEALERIDELVVKPRTGHGGVGVVVCPHADPADREATRRSVEADPEQFVAQELVCISTHPTACDGRLEPRHVDLRPFVIGVGARAVTAPVALTRVSLDRGSLVVNSSQDGGGKDTWLLR